MATWIDTLTEQEQAEVFLAQYYIGNLNHGTGDHLAFSVINKLADLLNQQVDLMKGADTYSITVDNRVYVVYRQMITVYELLTLVGKDPKKFRLIMVEKAMTPPEIPLGPHEMVSLHNRNEIFRTVRK